MLHDRRKAGRPRNVNRPPSNAHIATTKETINELDRLVNFQKMPIGQKLEHLIREIQYHRKNLVGQQPISQPNGLISHTMNTMNINESSEECFDRELAELREENGIVVETDEGIIQE